jgi:hypothetical protein
MMNRPTIREPLFGFITNGSEFVYLKLMQQDSPRYGLSRLFSLINPGNDLYAVLGVLKRLGEVVNSTKL